jgi:hypothetical protein
MATLAVQIEALAGTADNALQWANDGISAVIDRVLVLDPESSHLFATNIDDTTSIDISDRRHIISVARGSKIATEIPAEKRFAAAEIDSLQKATNDYPQYYYLNQTIQVLPAGSISVSKVDCTTLSNLNGSTISNFPLSLIPLVVNYAAMKSLQEKMVGYTGLSGLVLSLPSIPPQPTLSFSIADGITAVSNVGDVSLPEYVSVADPSISALDLSSVTAPISPSVPSFTYTDAALQERAEQLVLSLSGTVPTYDSPSMILKTAPIITDLSITSVVPLAPTISSQAVSSPSSLAPEYTKPSIVLGTTPIITNLTINSVAPIQPVSPSFATPTIGAITVDTTTISNFGTAPTYSSPALTPVDFSKITSLIEVDEDIELAQTKITEEQMKLTEFSSKLQDSLNVFNEENAEYQIKLQEATQQAQINAQKAQSQAQIDATDAQQETSLLLQKENQEYGASLQKYSAEIQEYQANVAKEVQQYQQNLEGDLRVWQAERQTDLQKYTSDIQNELNEFNKENVKYQATLQEYIQEAQLLDAHESRKLQKYQAEVQAYQSDVNTQVQEYQQNLVGDTQVWQAERTTELQKYGTDIQNKLNDFNVENTSFQADVQKDIQSFQADAGRRLQLMQQSTNIDVQNKAKSLEKEISEYGSRLQKYTGDLQQYQADVGKTVQEWSLNNLSFKLAKWQADIGENLNEYQAKVASIVQKYSADISRMGAFTQTEANKLAAVLQKKVAENNVELQRFGSALQDFSQRSQVYLAEYTADLQKVQVQYQWYEKQYAMVREQYEKGFEPFMIRRQQDGEQNRLRS